MNVKAEMIIKSVLVKSTIRRVKLRTSIALAVASELRDTNRQILLLNIFQCLHTFLDRRYLWFLFDCFDGPDAGERTGQSLRGLLTSLLQLRGCVVSVFRYPGLHILHLSDEHLLVNG